MHMSKAAAAITHFFERMEFIRLIARLSVKRSSNAHTKYTAIPIANGRKRIFIVMAPQKSNWLAIIKARLNPHPGDCIPVISLKRQGM